MVTVRQRIAWRGESGRYHVASHPCAPLLELQKKDRRQTQLYYEEIWCYFCYFHVYSAAELAVES